MARHYMLGRMHDKNTMYEIARGLCCALLQIKDTGSLTCLHKVSKTDDLAICLNSMPCSLSSLKCAARQSCHSDSMCDATGVVDYTHEQEQISDGDST